MTLPESIFVAIDLSSASDAVLRRALWLVHRPEVARVWLVHVIDARMLDGIAGMGLGLRTELEASARAAAAEALATIAERFRAAGARSVEVVCRVGRPEVELAELVKQTDPGLVIAGAGNRVWRQALLGSTVRRLVRLLHRPLWLVRGSGERAYDQILLGSDLDDASANGAAIACHYWPGARFEVMHVEENIDELLAGLPNQADFNAAGVRADRKQRMQQRLTDFVSANLPHAQGVARLEHGHPVASLLRRTREQPTDLLVLGRSGRAVPSGGLGSVAEGLVDLVECDLLLMPTG